MAPPRTSTALAGTCGTYCGACLAHRGEIATQAQELLERVRRQGFLSIARRMEPESGMKIDAFFEVLDRIARTPACPGCGSGGGVVDCPVRACARRRGQSTCGGCGELEPCAQGTRAPEPEELERRRRSKERGEVAAKAPFTASAFLARLTLKYGGWNRENLERIRQVGLTAWLEEVSRDESFRTVEKKRPEDFFKDE